MKKLAVATVLPATVLTLVFSVACGTTTTEFGDPNPNPNGRADASTADAPSQEPDAQVGAVFPTWKLEDIQPQSPMFGQTYGLEVFNDKILVAVLLQGF